MALYEKGLRTLTEGALPSVIAIHDFMGRVIFAKLKAPKDKKRFSTAPARRYAPDMCSARAAIRTKKSRPCVDASRGRERPPRRRQAA